MPFLDYYLVRPALGGAIKMKRNIKKENLLVRAIPRKLIPAMLLITVISCITAINVAFPIFQKSGAIGITLTVISIDNSFGNRYTAENSDRWDAKYLANQEIRESLYNSSDEFERTMSTNKAALITTFLGTITLMLLSMSILFKILFAIGKELVREMSQKRRRRLRRMGIKRVNVKQDFINLG
jgi:hypothetical protein